MQYAPFLALPGGVGHAIKEGLSSGSGFDGTVFRMSLRTRPGEISGFECTTAAVEREVNAEEGMIMDISCSNMKLKRMLRLFFRCCFCSFFPSPPHHLYHLSRHPDSLLSGGGCFFFFIQKYLEARKCRDHKGSVRKVHESIPHLPRCVPTVQHLLSRISF